MQELGNNIRTIRKAQHKTIKQLSESTGLSQAYISRLERGDINASIAFIKKIANALNIQIADLFQNGHKKLIDKNGEQLWVVRRDDRRKLVYPGLGFEGYLLTPSIRNIGIEFLLAVAEPGGSSGPDFYSHEGEECILIQKGELTLWINDTEIILREGDSSHFNSTIPHRWENTGKEKLEAIWVVVPPTY